MAGEERPFLRDINHRIQGAPNNSLTSRDHTRRIQQIASHLALAGDTLERRYAWRQARNLIVVIQPENIAHHCLLVLIELFNVYWWN